LENPFFHRLGSFLWGGIVLLIVLLAIYVSVGRLLTANVAAWQTGILQEINARAPFLVEAEHVNGEWQSFTPALVLTGLHLSIPGSPEPPLELSQGRIGVDVLNTLRTRSLQFSHMELVDLSLHGELSSEGSLRLQGFDGGGVEVAEQVREFLLNIELIKLRNNRLVLTMPSGEVRNLGLDLRLSRDGSHRRMEAKLTSTGGVDISVLAKGVGDPFRPEIFSGQLYADIQSTNLGAVKDLITDQSLSAWADGSADLQLWFDWENGTSSMELQFEGRDLLIESGDSSWQLPLDRFALQAHLQREQDRWSLAVANLQVKKGEVSLVLPRLQLEASGGALQVRANDIETEQVNAFISGMDIVPEILREVSSALHPRGRVSTLELSLGNTDQLADDWEVRANFDSIAVKSFKGAPGASSVSGYAEMAPGGGFFLLDSQTLTLDFPAIYREPLFFDDMHGTVYLEWDEDRVRLDSGVLTTQGEEGTAKVLLGLEIPRVPNETGIEMELLVGLQNAHPTHRVKYVPYVLNPSLLNWLDDSIGEGMIEQGAFLWRGSLRKNSAPLHTVQLAFNVTDTDLTYHPGWPPVLVREGIVLIDDSAVSVWANRAELFESSVESLSVETWLNAQGQITLALDGSVSGPAADGLRVLNESPLAKLVGSAFADWAVEGRLETDLELLMNLTNKSVAPRVEVETRWHDVDLTVRPGNLQIQGVSGEFDYSTSRGFSSRALKADFWGNTMVASLQQHHGETGGYNPATSVLDVELAVEVELADVRDWLQLDFLEFASGRTAADIDIRLTPGVPPVLTVDSDLRGVSLDLPQPWRKNEDEAQQLHLEMPLVPGELSLSLALGEELLFRLDLGEGGVSAGALGINGQPAELEEGVLRVTGQSTLLQMDEWLDFVARYFSGGETVSATPARAVEQGVSDSLSGPVAGADPDPETDAKAAPVLPLNIVIDAVRADTLVLRKQAFKAVDFSLAIEQSLWNLSLDTHWLRADLALPQDDGPYILDISHLNLDQLPDFSVSDSESDDEEQPDLNLPRVDVTVGNLFQSDRRLGDLAFELLGQGRVITAENITGEIAQLRLLPERPGRLVWHRGEGGYTELQTSLRFGDLGQTLEYFGYQRIVETSNGDFDLDLHWPGAPQAFSLLEGWGSMRVAIGAGSFLEAPSGAEGALRVVSILNLADIVGRLSLSNTFESGIPFDSVDGEINLQGGTLEVAHMDVKGGSSFQFSGVSKIGAKSLDGELVATLPVANNLPWIAALAASLPVAAGVFVVSQVFNKQMNRLSSAVYTIGGSWNEPKVDFDRIFDNTTQDETAAGMKGAGMKGAGLMGGTDTAAANMQLPPPPVDIPASAQPDSP
jgi:uncharacterized protein (TIGR02099 family)